MAAATAPPISAVATIGLDDGLGGVTQMMADGKTDPAPSQQGIEAAVADFIHRKGVTRCPTACVLPTQGNITASDRAALSAYSIGRELSRQAKIAQRARQFWQPEPHPPEKE